MRAADAGQSGDYHYLATELIDGEDLGRLVARLGPLPTAEACELVRQAALGLDEAHRQGLVHRDVKPSNLMLDRTGTVKVLDLGLARFANGFGTITESGQVVGTLDFMAPEQAGGAKRVDARADIYSLGCTLYFLLAGRPPFSGAQCDTAAAKIMAHLNAPPPTLDSFRRDVPLGLARCLARMMAKDPGDRFASMAQVAHKLAGYAEGAQPQRLLAPGAPGAAPPALAPWCDRIVTWSDVSWMVRRLGRAVLRPWARSRPPGREPRLRIFSSFTPVTLAVLAFLFLTGVVSCEYVPAGAPPPSPVPWGVVSE